MLSAILFIPLAGALLCALWPREQQQYVRYVATIFSLAAFIASIVAFAMFDRAQASGFQFIEHFTWIDGRDVGGAFTLQYKLGVDGLSLPMVLLTTGLTLLSVLISFGVELRPKEYFAWMLVLETGVLGVFLSLDFLLFFLFWEVELVPMYLLISIWGTGRKEYAALKFVLFTVAGSALMLVGIFLLHYSTNTFDFEQLNGATIQNTIVPVNLIFWLILAAFFIKLPVFPLHTWLPDAHTNAPTAVSVLLAGVLLKMGGYGILRWGVSLFPQAAKDFALLFSILAAINIIYGAFIVLRQQDLKRLIAYSSVSHMGYVLLGVSALKQVGLTGASLQMFTHGMITGLLFIMVGLVYDRTHTRDIGQMSGLMRRMPFIGVTFFMAGFASLGLPAMAGFVAELLVFLGTFDKFVPMTILGVVGVLLSAGYILWMLQRVFWGPPMQRWEGLRDTRNWWEIAPVVGLIAAIVSVGIYPLWIVDVVQNGVQPIVQRLG
ncbi:MAG TPA: NADH-quinone oxidoreductase subunit M [Dehalococcoidia bacterium]|nr:NADH-quinone oxidoreductase subunit M [Dehalococcoidia bacterium]